MPNESFKSRLRLLIGQGKIETVIAELMKAAAGTDQENDILHLSSSFQALRKSDQLGMLSHEQSRLQHARVTKGILDFIDDFEFPTEPSFPSPLPPSLKISEHDVRSGSQVNYLIPMSIGGALLLMIVVLVVFLPCPSSTQFIVFRIALALGAAGLVTVIPGFFEFDYKHFMHAGVRAGGALAIFAFVYLINPAAAATGGDRCNQPFDLAVFLTDTDGATPLINQGNLSLRFKNENRTEAIDAKGSANFRQLPAQAGGDTVVVELAAAGWQFTNGKAIMRFPVDGIHATLTIQRDSARYCCISGSVRDEANRFLPGVKLGIGSQFVESDSNGRFSLVIPVSRQAEKYDLTATHPGFRTWESSVYPATEQETKIVLQRE